MEGIGSRLGRASSRYGSAPAVFNGPVRKWKKQWVHVSSSLSYHTTTTFHATTNNASAVRLRRWTPISSSVSDERPRRKLRYTPIVVLEEKKKEAAKKTDNESVARKTNQSLANETSENDDIEEPGYEDTEKTLASVKSEAANKYMNNSSMDLDLELKGKEDDRDSDGANTEIESGKAGQMGFAN